MTNTLTTNPSLSLSTTDPRLAFEHFRPLAQALPEAEVEVCRADVPLVRINASRGVDAISPRLEELGVKRPDLRLGELLEIKPLALALVYAADRVPITGSPGEIAERLARLGPVREMTLLQLEIFGALGLVPVDRVRAIRSGTGKLDTARDAVAIAGMYVEFASVVTGKHPFTEEHFDILVQDGNWLVQELRPGGALRVRVERSEEALLRDRLWTLLLRRHDALREAAVALFGLRRLDEAVPPLQARQAAPRTPAPPTPEGPPSPPTGDKPAPSRAEPSNPA